MAKQITWQNVNPPDVRPEMNASRQAGIDLGNAISGIGTTFDKVIQDKSTRDTDKFNAMVNALPTAEARNAAYAQAQEEFNFLNVGDVSKNLRATEVHDFARQAEERQVKAAQLEQDVFKHQQGVDSIKLAYAGEKVANMHDKLNLAEDTQENIRLNDEQKRIQDNTKFTQDQKDRTLNAPIRKLKIQTDTTELEKKVKDEANQISLEKFRSAANEMVRGSKKSKKYLNESQKALTDNGMSLKSAVEGFQDFRDADLAESVGFNTLTVEQVESLNFNPAPTNEFGQSLPTPSISEFKRYEKKLATLLKQDPANKGVSDAAIKAKVAQITNTERYATARLAAIEVQKSIVSQQKVTTLTQTALVENNEKFHIGAELTGSRAVHIEKLLRSEYSSRYPTDAITTDQLTTEIDAVLQKIYDRYNPTSKAQKSAYANAVYKLFARNSAEPSPWGTNWLLGPDVLGNVDTHGKVDDTLSEKSVDLLSDAIAPYLLPADKKTKEDKDELLEKAKKELKGGKKFKSSGNFKNYLYPN